MTSSDDEDFSNSMFQEPTGYFEPEEPAKHTSYTLLSGQTLRLRLVGHNPLWVPTYPTARSQSPQS